MAGSASAASAMPSAVSATLTPSAQPTPTPTLLRKPAASPAPNRWANTVPKPWVSPRIALVTSQLKNPAAPTAANASIEISRPTMALSAML